jgi:hypothetical protein
MGDHNANKLHTNLPELSSQNTTKFTMEKAVIFMAKLGYMPDDK